MVAQVGQENTYGLNLVVTLERQLEKVQTYMRYVRQILPLTRQGITDGLLNVLKSTLIPMVQRGLIRVPPIGTGNLEKKLKVMLLE